MTDSTERVQQVADLMSQGSSQFEATFFDEILKKINIEKAYVDDNGIPVTVFKFYTRASMSNFMGAAHGGSLTTVLDWFTTLAAAADPRYWAADTPTIEEVLKFKDDMGLSRNLRSQFLKPVQLEGTYYLECRVLANTKRNSFTTMTILDDKGNVYFQGTHDKIKLYKPVTAKL